MSARPTAKVPEPLLTPKQVAEILNVSLATVKDWRYRGGGPAFVRVGDLARYEPAALAAFISANRQTA